MGGKNWNKGNRRGKGISWDVYLLDNENSRKKSGGDGEGERKSERRWERNGNEENEKNVKERV